MDMDTKSTKKSLKSSGLALLVCIAMLIGTTFAWFTDSITNSGNKIEAGSLDVTLKEWNGDQYADVAADPIFNYDKWEPGYTDTAAVKIGNAGNLSLKYKVDFVSEGGATANKLAEVIDVYYLKDGIAPDKMPTSFADLQPKGFVKLGTLSDFLNKAEGAATGKLAPEGADYAILALHMQESAGNEYQNLTVGGDNGFDIIVNATQLNSEKDGFGNPDYDQEAKNPVIASSETELYDAVANAKEGGTVKLSKDLTLDKPLTVADKTVTLDLNGKALKDKAGSGNNLIQATGGASITVTDGELTAVGRKDCVIFARDDSSVLVEDCAITTSSNSAYAVVTNGAQSKDTKIVIKNSTITSTQNYACYFPAGEILLQDCDVKGAVIISGGDVTIDGGTYTADGFTGQEKIWHKEDTISYMTQFASKDGCGHMGDSILIMDRRAAGYEMKAVTIKNVDFKTKLTLKDGSKATAYAIKYVDYEKKPDTDRVNLVIQGNTYEDKLSGGKDPLMFITIDGEDLDL